MDTAITQPAMLTLDTAVLRVLESFGFTPDMVIGHSLGGSVALTYSGLYPETVTRLVSIEGMGPPPQMLKDRLDAPAHERLQSWVNDLRKSSGRIPRRYASLEEAYERMQTENPHLTEAQARHLTSHGSNQNEDGTYSWKFDNYVRNFSPIGLTPEATYALYGRITCPTLLVRGTESWASDPVSDGRAAHFENVTVASIENAGHWVHHDQLDEFLSLVRDFLTGRAHE